MFVADRRRPELVAERWIGRHQRSLSVTSSPARC